MKICTKLYQELTVREDGCVYTCCHSKEIIGNIKLETLNDIWHSKLMLSLQQLNIEGRLPCIEYCKRDHNFVNKTDVIELKPKLKRLLIMISIYCNIKCIMCYQHPQRKITENSLDNGLSSELLIKQIEFHSFEDIIMQGGEPTVIPEAKKLFYYLLQIESPYPYINLITNGLVLSDEMLEGIVSRSRFYMLSLNAATEKTHQMINVGSCWEKVIENLKKLQYKRDQRSSNLKIIGSMTIVPQNILEVGKFIRMKNYFGFDQITFNYDKRTVPKFLQNNIKLKQQIIKDISDAIDNEKDINSIRLHKIKQLGILQ